jgi:hypothetical protein
MAVVEGQASSGFLNATFSDTNALAPSGLTVSISWGDGSGADTTSAIVTEVGGAGGTTYTISATHTFPEEGSFTVGLTVQETANSANTDTTTTSSSASDAPLAQAPTVFSGAGGAGSATALAAFQAAIGGRDNGTAGPQAGGFRHLTWDGVALDGSDPGSQVITSGKTVAIAVNRMQASGIDLDRPLAVSGDGFTDVNSNAGGLFGAFSPADVVAPFNTNTFTLEVVSPSDPATTSIPRATRGLGLVFLNVEDPSETTVQYLNGNDVLATAAVPAGGPGHHPSFVGELFNAPVVTRVVVTLGGAEIFRFDGTTVVSGGTDIANNLVAADDLVLAESQAQTLTATAGASFAGSVATFGDLDPGGKVRDYSATIDWGDGSTSAGAVAPGAGGQSVVSGTHTYSQPGTYPVRVAIGDLGGAGLTLYDAAQVDAAALPQPSLAALATLAAPNPAPGAPHCSLTIPAARLTRVRVAVGTTSSHRRTVFTPSRLRLLARCDQNTSGRIQATATLTAKPAAKGKHRRKTKPQTLQLGAPSVSLPANSSTPLTLTPPAAVLRRLRAAAKRHDRIAVTLTLIATNANGSATTATTAAMLQVLSR